MIYQVMGTEVNKTLLISLSFIWLDKIYLVKLFLMFIVSAGTRGFHSFSLVFAPSLNRVYAL